MSISLNNGEVTVSGVIPFTIFTADLVVVCPNETFVRTVVITCTSDFSFDASALKASGAIHSIQSFSVVFTDQPSSSTASVHLKGMSSITEVSKSTLMIPMIAYDTNDQLVCAHIPCKYRSYQSQTFICMSCKTTAFESKRALAIHLVSDFVERGGLNIDIDEVCNCIV